LFVDPQNSSLPDECQREGEFHAAIALAEKLTIAQLFKKLFVFMELGCYCWEHWPTIGAWY